MLIKWQVSVKFSLQCFDTVGWVTGRASWLWKAGGWFVGGGDLTGVSHVLWVQLSPPKKSKRETFWYQLIQFHLDKGWEDGESISVKSCHSWAVSYFASHCMMVQVKFMLLIYRGFTFYKMSNLDNRIANADQLLTQDVEKLSNSIAELYSNLSKVGSSFVCFGFKLWSAVFSHPYRCNFLPRLLSIQI